MIGTFINERYHVVGLLGKGGNAGRGGDSQVYLALDERTGREVAIKVASSHLEVEGRMLTKMAHPLLPQCYEYGRIDGRDDEAWFLAMEYLQGETLCDYWASHYDKRRYRSRDRCDYPGQMRVEDVIFIGARISEWFYDLASRDPQVFYGDLHWFNVMLLPHRRLKVVDLGLAIELVEDLDSENRGVPRYMAPELWRDALVSPEADMYALGLLLHQLLTGKILLRYAPPCRCDSLPCRCGYYQFTRPRGHGKLDRLVMRMLEQDVEGRITAAEALPIFRDLERGLSWTPEEWQFEVQTEPYCLKASRPPICAACQQEIPKGTDWIMLHGQHLCRPCCELGYVLWNGHVAILPGSPADEPRARFPLCIETTRKGKVRVGRGYATLSKLSDDEHSLTHGGNTKDALPSGR